MKEEREEICLLMIKYRFQCFGDYFVHVRLFRNNYDLSERVAIKSM